MAQAAASIADPQLMYAAMARFIAQSLLLCLACVPAMQPALAMSHCVPGPSADALPAPPPWLAELDSLYDRRLRVAGLDDRMFAPETWWAIATPLLARARGFQVTDIARSAEGRPLRHLQWGNGKTGILLWSQMHGDESTATMALADLLQFLGDHPDNPVVRRMRRQTTLHLLPLMNPDGAARFQRRNAQGIDINRDAQALASPEARALHLLRERVKPAFGFNLHDQRVGYRVGDSTCGTAIALLAPPPNEAREVDAARARAIEVTVAIRAALEPSIGGHIAKWDDSFNPRAFGDLTARAGISTILIESGGIEGDLQKQRLRKLNFLALVTALDAIASGSHAGLPHAPYDDLPQNGDIWPDLLIAGATLVQSGIAPAKADVLIDFKQPLLERGGIIKEIGDLGETRARRRIDAGGLYMRPLQRNAGTIGTQAPALATDGPAWLQLSRDPDGREVVWTLPGDVDPAHPTPATALP